MYDMRSKVFNGVHGEREREREREREERAKESASER